MKFGRLSAAALALTATLGASSLRAEDFTAATYNGANSPMADFLNDFAARVKAGSNGAIGFQVYSGGSLLPPEGSLSGLVAGVADLAQVTGNYIPADVPLTATLADVSFVADDQMALAFAYVETKLLNQRLLDEAKKADVVYGSGFSIGIYSYICANEVNKIEDLVGKRIRTATGAHIAFSSEIGAVAVQVPATEIYTGLQRGSIDCAAGSPEFLTTFFRLTEVAKSVYLMPLGSNANDGYYFNKNFWQARSLDERKLMLKELSAATARSMIAQVASVEEAWEAARAANIRLVEPEPEALERLKAFQEKFLAELPKTTMEKRGVEDPTDVINSMIELQAKWKKLLSEINAKDEAAVTALLDREIFDKIDAETYGMDD
ncbi:TRAP transporter substrate-binding protein DctP [Mesorhizobium sp. A556]